MGFEEFKEKIVEGLQEIYGDSAEIVTSMVIKNNGSKYNGLYIFLNGMDCKSTPILNLDDVYDAFEGGWMDMEGCIQEVCHQRETLKSSVEIEEFAESANDWEQVKDRVFPILLSTEENRELLEGLVSTPILDLSIAYVIRRELSGKDNANIKVSKGLLERYSISSEQLHRQAMINMEKDGYEFRDMIGVIKSICGANIAEKDNYSVPEMYVLTNAIAYYGAVGILNKKLIREFAGDRNFIILPSSVHETLFVPVNDDADKEIFDDMVTKVNEEQVRAEEILSDHSYYYDAANNEIRMCA